jgi:hypothetical protein
MYFHQMELPVLKLFFLKSSQPLLTHIDRLNCEAGMKFTYYP